MLPDPKRIGFKPARDPGGLDYWCHGGFYPQRILSGGLTTLVNEALKCINPRQ